jgi:hypothetical protein
MIGHRDSFGSRLFWRGGDVPIKSETSVNRMRGRVGQPAGDVNPVVVFSRGPALSYHILGQQSTDFYRFLQIGTEKYRFA